MPDIAFLWSTDITCSPELRRYKLFNPAHANVTHSLLRNVECNRGACSETQAIENAHYPFARLDGARAAVVCTSCAEESAFRAVPEAIERSGQ
jgi:hypothetical protein